MYFESDYGKIQYIHEDTNKLSSNVSSRELFSMLHFSSLLVRTPSLITPRSHGLYVVVVGMFFFALMKQTKWKVFKYLELCMPHSYTHAPLYSAYKLVVLFRNKLQLWVWDDMCWKTYTITSGSENPRPIKFYLILYWLLVTVL